MARLPRPHLQPRAWLTRDYWRLETSPISRGGWSNDDVDIVPRDKRTWRELDYLWLWLADGANVGTMFVSILMFSFSRQASIFGQKSKMILNHS